MRFIFIYLSIIFISVVAQNDEMIQTSGRLFRDVMEMFAPSSTDDRRASASSLSRDTSESSPASFISSLLPPFGINKQIPADDATASRLTSSSASLVSSVSNLFKPQNPQQDIESNHPLMPVGSNVQARNAGQWSSIAKDVMGLFTGNPTTTTTTPPPPIMGLDMLNPRFIQQLMPDWMQPLNPYRKQSSEDLRRSPMPLPQQQQQPILNAQNLFGPWTGILDNNSPATQIDTGGNTFDRLVVRENADPEDPLGSLMGGKFNEKGIQWSDGNIKFVNKMGNKLLGSEVAVRDRSVDIPIQRWFDIANNLVSAYSNSDPARI